MGILDLRSQESGVRRKADDSFNNYKKALVQTRAFFMSKNMGNFEASGIRRRKPPDT